MSLLDQYLDHLIDQIDVEGLIACIDQEPRNRPVLEDESVLDGSTRRGME